MSIIAENNRLSLKEMISYLSKLKQSKVINEKQFQELVVLSCANFIENEVEARITKSISDKVSCIFNRI